MMKSWQNYAKHILDAIDKLNRIHETGDILTDDIYYDAALRNLQTLSEATQRLPDELKDQYPAIPWRSISGFRNILVHNYLGDIDSTSIMRIIDDQLPELKSVIMAMLADARS